MIYLKPLIRKLVNDEELINILQNMNNDEEIFNALKSKVSIENIEAAFTHHYGIKYKHLDFDSINENLIEEFDLKFLRQELILPYEFNEKTKEWFFAISDLTNRKVIDIINKSVKNNGHKANFTFAFKHEIEHFYKSLSGDNVEKKIIPNVSGDAKTWVETIINNGIELRASDIHIERQEEGLRVRYRVDGMMTGSQVFPMTDDEVSNIYVRLKIIGNMDISEKRRSQDGRIDNYEYNNNKYSLRVSTVNTIQGEKVVMRIFSESQDIEDFDKLGFTEEQKESIMRMINKPNGIIYLAGATGSGKTTTLYTMINQLDKDNLNIYTIENPVEKNIEGVNQVQIDEASGNTYPSVLKTLLRQDPDIMVVGEIREAETARLAVQASLTGHLVMTTIHANNAVESINRLINMGVESYLIGASSVGFISQRLVRVLCPHCKIKVDEIPEHEKMWINETLENFNYEECKANGQHLYEAVGCKKCVNGYKGRIAVVEIIEVDTELKNLISKKANIKEIRDYLNSIGYKEMKHDGINKALKGITSIEELMGKLQD